MPKTMILQRALPILFRPALVILALFPAALLATPAPLPSRDPAPPATGVQGPPNGLVPPGPRAAGPAPLVLPQPSVPQPQPQMPRRVPDAANPAGPPPARANVRTGAQGLPRRSPPPGAALPAPQQERPADAAVRPAVPPPEMAPADTPVAQPPSSPALSVSGPGPGAAVAQSGGLAPAVWLAGAAALLLFGALVWWRRRARRPLALTAPDRIGDRPGDHAGQAPVAPVPARARAPAAPAGAGPRAQLSLRFEPLGAQSTLFNLRLRYAVIVANDGDADAAAVALRFGMFTGAQADERALAGWLAAPGPHTAHHAVDRIVAGGAFRFEGEISAALDAINMLTIDGRRLAIPVIAVDTRYATTTGQGQTARAFVIGRDTGIAGAKLAPFRFDRGPSDFAPLGCRDTGISRLA